MEERNRFTDAEMLIAYNIVYIVIGFAAVSVAVMFGIDCLTSILLYLSFMVYSNWKHFNSYWRSIFKRLPV